MSATNPAGNKEYVSWPATVTPGRDTYPHYGTQADASTTVHSPKGWEWEEVTEGLDKLRTAIDLAQGVTRFTRIDTSQLRVTDTAFINEAVIQKIWTRVVTAEEGEFAKLKAGMIEAHQVVADQVRAGAIDGMTITGALIRTATTGARIELDTTGLRAYRPNGTTSFSVNARTGYVYVDGNIQRTDTWSYCAFTDFTYDGHDTNPAGWKTGVGLSMNRLNNPARWDAALILQQKPEGTLLMTLRAPGDSTYNAGNLPNVTLSEEEVGFWVGGNRLTLSDEGLWMQSPQAQIGVNTLNAYFRAPAFRYSVDGNTYRIWCQDDTAGIAPPHPHNSSACLSLWNHGKTVWLGANEAHGTLWNHDGVAHTFGGMTMDGSKPFIARHPLDPERLLLHACTESPWDGIEYWGTLTLDDHGVGEAVLPDYVPALHRRGAPVAVLLTTDHGTAHTPGWDRQSTTIPVTGEPGATVQWLLKAARVVDGHEPGYTVTEPPVEGIYVEVMKHMRDNPHLYGTL